MIEQNENNIRIGVLSLYYTNYNCGGLLQAYALCKAFCLLGYNAEQICFNSNQCSPEVNETLISKFQRHVKDQGFIPTFKMSINSIRTRRWIRMNRKKLIDAFSPFEKEVPHSSTVYTRDEIDKSLDNYDFFVTGSDQVWSWVWQINKDIKAIQSLDVYLLEFVPENKKKIAYAASISCPYIPDELREKYYKAIRRLDSVSLRESQLISLFPDDLKRKIDIVVDPTLLLSKKQWSDFLLLEKPNKPTEQFIFCYFLGATKEDRKAIAKIKKLTGLKVILRPGLATDNPKDFHLADVEDMNMGPAEFVKYIRDATLVLTNSFHATIFSLNFNTPFFVFDRKSEVSMNSRIESVASDYGVKHRMLSYDFKDSDILNSKIDWNHVNKILEANKKHSYDFLKEALNNSKNDIDH